ncbi:MAG: HNH endonuclease signature motif containing protein [Chitinophagaceae bacterium]|nr:HNH endonuclease signature motif containing protein [Chitinophagaceae bacterium]
MAYKKQIKHRINDDIFRKVCNDSASMAEAAAVLNLHFNSFKKRAVELNCYKPNQAGKGLKKRSPKIQLSEIIEKGNHPHYQSYKLKNRLISEGIKTNVCETCGCSSWQGKQLNLELHHVDGNRQNHALSNLKLLCPNCHSQTETFRAKNKKI